MQPRHAHFNAYLALLIVLLVLAGFFYGLYSFFGIGAPQSAAPAAVHIPPPTTADETSVQQPFQYLVSYTVSGFHPATLSMKKGQTVRFTDNSPEPVTIQGANARSPELQQGEYWQYTASTTGETDFITSNSDVKVTVTQ